MVTSTGTLGPKRKDNRETVVSRHKPWDRRVGLRRSALNPRNRWARLAFSPASTGAMMLLALLICGCVPTTIDTVPLQQASLAPPQSESISSDRLPSRGASDCEIGSGLAGAGRDVGRW